MFLSENPRRERLVRISLEDRDSALNDDGAAIELRSHEMHSDTAHLDAMRKCLTLRIDAGERREERWMDIQDGIGIRLEQRRPDEPHIAGQTDKAHAASLQLPDDGAIVIVARRPSTMTDNDRLDPSSTRTLEASGIVAIGNDAGDGRLEPAITDRVDERLKIAPAPRDQDTQPAIHDRLV